MENYAKFPILSNRQIYPEASRKTSPQKDFNGSTNSLNSDSNFGSRKFLNLIHDGQKFCLVQGDQNAPATQGKKSEFDIWTSEASENWRMTLCKNLNIYHVAFDEFLSVLFWENIK